MNPIPVPAPGPVPALGPATARDTPAEPGGNSPASLLLFAAITLVTAYDLHGPGRLRQLLRRTGDTRALGDVTRGYLAQARDLLDDPRRVGDSPDVAVLLARHAIAAATLARPLREAALGTGGDAALPTEAWEPLVGVITLLYTRARDADSLRVLVDRIAHVAERMREL